MPRVIVLVAWLMLMTGNVASAQDRQFAFDFGNGSQGWVAGFADYPTGDETFYELRAGIEQLPASLGSPRTAFMVSGNNHSDDLFMFLKRRLDGLAPNRAYEMSLSLTFATNAGTGCAGIGGAPGESVFVKTGATVKEPQAILEKGMYRMNIDIGHQSNSGRDAVVIGNVANGDTTCANQYRSKTLHHRGTRTTTDDRGGTWVIVGTDSGFEGTTRLYYTDIVLRFTDTGSTIAR